MLNRRRLVHRMPQMRKIFRFVRRAEGARVECIDSRTCVSEQALRRRLKDFLGISPDTQLHAKASGCSLLFDQGSRPAVSA